MTVQNTCIAYIPMLSAFVNTISVITYDNQLMLMLYTVIELYFKFNNCNIYKYQVSIRLNNIAGICHMYMPIVKNNQLCYNTHTHIHIYI